MGAGTVVGSTDFDKDSPISGQEQPGPSSVLKDALVERIVQRTTVRENVGGEIIVISGDRLRLILLKYLKAMEAKRSWIAPGGILATLVATLSTSKFHDALLSAPTWQAVFILSAAASAVWLAVSIRKALSSTTLDDVIAELKGQPVRLQ